MFSLSAKTMKLEGERPDKMESGISRALLELEINLDLKAQLRELNIRAAKETEVAEIFTENPNPASMPRLEKSSVGNMLSLSLRDFCLSRLEKAIQKVGKTVPGAVR
ncbi:hypothetical protein P7K49_026028, partial [Saguinus oedipus]